ncbi:MAG TPA: shikimate dehydrogenase [Sphingomonas sp.]|nr:shikimate dehydrogenase [Sphingomonas sp.]
MIYAEVIGDPIAQSKSPKIHKFWLEKLGIDADYRAQLVIADGVGAFLGSRREDRDWRGCNVTMPHKQAVQPFLDTVSRDASRIGAVNTIYRQADRLIGENTDGEGFLEPLQPWLGQSHLFRMARVLGAGGAARAVAAALVDHGFTLVVAARGTAKCEMILAPLPGEHHVTTLNHFAAPTDFEFDDREGLLDLVVNTTPLGMTGNPPLDFDFSHVPPGSVVYDIVTSPVRTPLLIAAEERGFRTIDGLAMLVGQAAAAFRLFFGAEAPREHDAELRALLTA